MSTIKIKYRNNFDPEEDLFVVASLIRHIEKLTYKNLYSVAGLLNRQLSYYNNVTNLIHIHFHSHFIVS
jgi:hypothetical protein